MRRSDRIDRLPSRTAPEIPAMSFVRIQLIGFALAGAAAIFSATAHGTDRSLEDFNAAPSLPAAAAPAPASILPPMPERGAISSEHGRIQTVPHGHRCAFTHAPLIEAAADLARAWSVPIAYFGPMDLKTDAVFTAPTLATALLQLADRTNLRVERCGSGWSLAETPETEALPLASAGGGPILAVPR